MRASLVMPRDVEAQRVAQLQPQRGGDALFHADGAALLRLPAPRHHLVVFRLAGGEGQVELAVHQAARAVFDEIVGRHRLAVHRHEPAAEHGEPVQPPHAGGPQLLHEGIALLGSTLMTKRFGASGGVACRQLAIRSVRSSTSSTSASSPTASALVCTTGVGGAGADLPRGQHHPARRRRFVDQAAQQLHGDPAEAGEHQHGAGEAAHRDPAQLQVAAGRQQQRDEAGHAHAQHQQRSGPQVADVAPDHPQGRHLRQLQHRRQAEGQQQGQAHAHAEGHRPETAGGSEVSTSPPSSAMKTKCTA
jgi:hypothetical protein